MRPVFLLFISLSLALPAAAPTPARAAQDAGAAADAKDNATREFWDSLNQGDVARRQGGLSEALRLYRSGQAVAGRQSKTDPANAEWRRLLSVSYDRIGDVLAEQSKIFSRPDAKICVPEHFGPLMWNGLYERMEQGKKDDALKAFRDSQAIIERLAKADPANLEWQRDLSKSYNRIGSALAAQYKWNDALKAFRDSQAIIERLAKADPDSSELQRELSFSYVQISGILGGLEGQDKMDAALKAGRDGLAIIERLAKANPANVEWQRDLSVFYVELGNVLWAQGRLDDVLKAFRDSQAIIERLAKADPANVEWQRELSFSYVRISESLAGQNKLDDASKAFHDGQAIIERLANANPANVELQRDLSVFYAWPGYSLEEQDKLDDALKAYRDSLAIRERLAKADPANAELQRDLSASYDRIGKFLVRQSKFEGLNVFRDGLEFLVRQSKLHDGLNAFRDGLAIRERLAKADPADAQRQVDLVVSYARLGQLHAKTGNKAKALSLFQRGRAIVETIRHEDWRQGLVLEDFDEAIAALGEAKRENKPVEGAVPAEPADKANAKTLDKVQVNVGASGEAKWFTPGAGKDESFSDCAADCPEMVVAPGGSFMMGSPSDEPERSVDEGPQHQVTIKQPFAVGKYAVTFAEWDACVADGSCGGFKPSDQGWGRGDQPVINVSWRDAEAYAAWLSKKTGKTYRLLSEAEREYVARAGTTTPFWWGSSITPDLANYNGARVYKGGGEKGEYRHRTAPVKSFQANSWGLYQVHGNVLEWTDDCWNDDYNGAPTDGSARTTGGCDSRVLRGGSWVNGPQGLRAALRTGAPTDGLSVDTRVSVIGFRVARTLNP